MCNNVIWTHEYLKSTFFFIADKDAAAEKLSKNNQEIGAIIKAYYGTTAGQKVSEILDKQKPILNKAMAAVKFHDDAKNDLAKIASSLAEYLKELNPNWGNASDFADSMIPKQDLHLFKLCKNGIIKIGGNHWLFLRTILIFHGRVPMN